MNIFNFDFDSENDQENGFAPMTPRYFPVAVLAFILCRSSLGLRSLTFFWEDTFF